MKLCYGMLAWGAIGLVLGLGLFLAVKGSIWLLVLSVIGFIVAVGRIGCSTH
ncbi:MAG: hypothetical protein O2960_28910 [Verrucomicrobia bacterium]|nr:hypothetical protein [Verrucomicrobiota bacterium]